MWPTEYLWNKLEEVVREKLHFIEHMKMLHSFMNKQMASEKTKSVKNLFYATEILSPFHFSLRSCSDAKLLLIH
jgi:hypothetical protein